MYISDMIRPFEAKKKSDKHFMLPYIYDWHTNKEYFHKIQLQKITNLYDNWGRTQPYIYIYINWSSDHTKH